MKSMRYRMCVPATCYFTVEAASEVEAAEIARAVRQQLPFGEGEPVAVEHPNLPEGEVVFYLDDGEPSVANIWEPDE